MKHFVVLTASLTGLVEHPPTSASRGLIFCDPQRFPFWSGRNLSLIRMNRGRPKVYRSTN